MTHVPYKGSGQSIPDVASGRVQLMSDVPATGAAHIAAGRVKGLVVTGPRRAPTLPNVPTVAETIPGFTVLTWWGIYGPKGLGPELTNRIHAAFFKAMRSPELVERYKVLGVEPGMVHRRNSRPWRGKTVPDGARSSRTATSSWNDTHSVKVRTVRASHLRPEYPANALRL